MTPHLPAAVLAAILLQASGGEPNPESVVAPLLAADTMRAHFIDVGQVDTALLEFATGVEWLRLAVSGNRTVPAQGRAFKAVAKPTVIEVPDAIYATGWDGHVVMEAKADGTIRLFDGTGGLVNINTATAAELAALPGIGPTKAQAIVDDRQANGPLVTVQDLARVSGIGPATVKRVERAGDGGGMNVHVVKRPCVDAFSLVSGAWRNAGRSSRRGNDLVRSLKPRGRTPRMRRNVNKLFMTSTTFRSSKWPAT